MRKYVRATTLFFLLLVSIGVCIGEEQVPREDLTTWFPSLTEADLAQLESDRELTRYFYDSSTLSFFPRIPQDLTNAVSSSLSTVEPTVGVESLFLLEVPWLTLEGGTAPSASDILTIYNTLRSVSSLQGVQYYSASRQRMRTFFKEAWVIADKSSRKKLPDPLVKDIPAEDTILIHQRDLTFGRNVSEAVYRFSNGVINMSLTNLLIMRYALLPLIREQGMQTHMVIIPMEGFIGFYGYCSVETISFLGIEKSKSDSFYNRMKALYTWFSENLPNR